MLRKLVIACKHCSICAQTAGVCNCMCVVMLVKNGVVC